MRRIYIVGGALLLLVGFYFMNAIDLAAGALTLGAATQGIGRMRVFGKIAGFALAALAVVQFVQPDWFGSQTNALGRAAIHAVAALTFLYVGLLAPPRL